MKKNILSLLLVLNIFSSNNSFASHMCGGEINYSCTSTPGIYLITLRLYRECSGIPMGSCTGSCSSCSENIGVTGADGICNGASYGSFTLSLLNVKDVGGLTTKNICTNNGCSLPAYYTPGYEVYTFQGNADLSGIPSTCCNIRISFTECCLSGSINNLGSGNSFYMETIINRCLTPCDNSPKFNNFENYVYAPGQQVYQSFGATDVDGDSLSYNFSPWLQGPGMTAAYVAPYNGPAFLPYTGTSINDAAPNGFHLNTQTGFFQFTPSYTSGFNVGAVGITVNEFRKISGTYVKIGSVTRYFLEYFCGPFSNTRMHIATIPSAPANEPMTDQYVCAGSSICFDLIAKDTNLATPALSDTSFVFFDTSMFAPGMTVTNNYSTIRPREDSKHFCWTPNNSLVRSQPYTFTVYIRNSKPPVPSWESRTFRIFVLAPPSGTFVKTSDLCKKWQVSFVQPTGVTTGKWKICRTSNSFSNSVIDSFVNVSSTPLMHFNAGDFPVQYLAANAGCSAVLYDTIHADTPINIFARDTSFCKGGTANFSFAAHNGSPRLAPNYTYRWFEYPDTSSTVLNDPFLTLTSFSVSPQTTKRYILQARDWYGCRAYDSSVWVRVNNPAFNSPDSMRICNGNSYLIDRGNNNGNAKKYLWSTGDTTRTISRNSNSVLSLTITDTSGCSNSDSFHLSVNSPVIANAGADTIICGTNTILLHASGGQKFQWKNLITSTIIAAKSLNPNATILIGSTSSFEATTFVTQNGLECWNRDTMNVNVVNNIPVSAGNPRSFCIYDPVFDLSSSQNSSPTGGIWSGTGTSLNNNNYYFDPALANLPPQTNTLYYNLNNAPCNNFDSVSFKVYPKPITPAITGMASVPRALTTSYNVSNNAGSNFSWFVSNGNIVSGNGTSTVNVSFLNAGTGIVKVLETAASNCLSDTATKNISVSVGVGINVNSSFEHFRIFPNPTSGILNIELTTDEKQIQIEVIDVLGKVVKINSFTHHFGNFKTEMDLNSLTKGIYFVNVKAGDRSIQTKVAIQ
ncbi:MAG: T9SS type A sorting domain-containing protein [Bacteroidia bacterium]